MPVVNGHTPEASVVSGPTRTRIKRNSPVIRLAVGIEKAAAALDMSRRAFERARAAGQIPPPDLRIGKRPLWAIRTLRKLLAKGGAD